MGHLKPELTSCAPASPSARDNDTYLRHVLQIADTFANASADQVEYPGRNEQQPPGVPTYG